jgi:hypothetical protein
MILSYKTKFLINQMLKDETRKKKLNHIKGSNKIKVKIKEI